MTLDDIDQTLQNQLTYYRERAAEYEQFYTREGRYDRGPELNASFTSDVQALQRFVDAARDESAGDVLELAGGTGFWTQRWAKRATSLTVVDGAPETLAIAKGRVGRADVHWIQANLFEWKPQWQFDTVFFGFWLSHVPPERFESFWKTVKAATKPNGRVLFVDSRFQQTSTAKDHVLTDPGATKMTRKLNDGRSFEIIKVFYKPDELKERLASLGWNFEIGTTPTYFLHGVGRRSDAP
jgi:ubiquinone/menaquinone biosynthesis C-methylase UbiE